jgi:hypothetical protein
VDTIFVASDATLKMTWPDGYVLAAIAHVALLLRTQFWL